MCNGPREIHLFHPACPVIAHRRIVLGLEGVGDMPKLKFSGKHRNIITNNILILPVIPTGAFSIIQDGVPDSRQNVNTPRILWQKVSQWFSILVDT